MDEVLAQQREAFAPPVGAAPQGVQPIGPRSGTSLIAQGQSLDIPPVAERPDLIEEGPRVRVSSFRIQGVVNRPAPGISVAEIEGVLDAQLREQPPDGYTVGELELVADEVTLYYRERGLIVAQAFVPAQDVQNGVVTLQVVEGVLGNVTVEDNQSYDAAIVALPFNQILSQPVHQDSIEEALLNLQNFPGLTVFGTLRQGQQIGETELLVRVLEEDGESITPSVDNYGSELTGELRAMVSFNFNNLAGNADRLSGYILETHEPDNGTFGGLSYSAKAGSRAADEVGGGFARNVFQVTDAETAVDLNIEGTVEEANLFWRHSFANTRNRRSSSVLDFSRKRAVTEQPGVDPQDDLIVVSYTWDYYSVSQSETGAASGINLGFLTIAGGENFGDVPSRVGAIGGVADNFSKLAFGYRRLQRVSDDHSLLLRFDGQFSPDPLIALEQYLIGGPANVRAYPVATSLVDSGGSLSLEWIMDAPGFADRQLGNQTWGDVLQFSLFYDYAGGEINDPLPNQSRTVNLRGYGVGVQFNWNQRFYMRIDASKPIIEDTPSQQLDTQYYASMSFTF